MATIPTAEKDVDVESQASTHTVDIDDLMNLVASGQLELLETGKLKRNITCSTAADNGTESDTTPTIPNDPASPQRQTSGGSSSGSGFGSSEKQRRLSRLMHALEDQVEKRQLELVEQGSPYINHLAHQVAWVVHAAFAISAVACWALWTFYERNPGFVVTFFVQSIAAAAYLAKATGMGDVVMSGKQIPLLRYIDWIVTTPLMLYELCHIGHAPQEVTMMVIGCDVLMLAFGIVGASINRERHFRLKYVWFFMSCGFYAIMLTTLHVDVAYGSALHLDADVQSLFSQLEVLTLAVWSCYPVVALLGRAHAKVVQKGSEDMCFMLLDVLAKIGMEGLIVTHALMHHSSAAGH